MLCTGLCKTLRPGAVPSVFSVHEKRQNRNTKISGGEKSAWLSTTENSVAFSEEADSIPDIQLEVEVHGDETFVDLPTQSRDPPRSFHRPGLGQRIVLASA